MTKYTEKRNKGGIGKSTFTVRMEPKGESTKEKCCALCPNRMKKLTRVEACKITNFKITRLVFTDEVTAICDHMSPGVEQFLNNLGEGKAFFSA